MCAELAKRKYLPAAADELGHVEEGPGGSDNSEANGSSIALLAEYDDAKVLLTGNAFADVLTASLIRAKPSAAKPIPIDLWKLAHHGSWANFTHELFALVRTKRYLVFTDGTGHGHPHASMLNYIIDHYPGRGRPELIFNYRSATTEPWTRTPPQSSRRWTATYPAGWVLLL
jgi:hypothetical protein